MGCCSSSPDDDRTDARQSRRDRDVESYQALPDSSSRQSAAPKPSRAAAGSPPSPRASVPVAIASDSPSRSAGGKSGRHAAGHSTGDIVGSLRQDSGAMIPAAEAAQASQAAERAAQLAARREADLQRRRAVVERVEAEMLDVAYSGLGTELEDPEDEDAVSYATALVAVDAVAPRPGSLLADGPRGAASTPARPGQGVKPAQLMHIMAVL